MKRITQNELVARLMDEGYLNRDQEAFALSCIQGSQRVEQPWYIRLIQGFGGWFASLVLLGGVLLMVHDMPTVMVVFGVGVYGLALRVERRLDGSVLVGQLCHSGIVIGTGLVAFGGISLSHTLATVAGLVAAMASVAFLLARGSVIQCISLTTSLFCVLYVARDILAEPLAVAVITCVYTVTLAAIMWNERVARQKLHQRYGPVLWAMLVAAAFGCGWSTVNEINRGIWVTTSLGIGVAGVLLSTVRRICNELEMALGSRELWGLQLLVVAVSACLIISPGSLFSILLIVLSLRSAHRTLLGVAIGLLLLFGSHFYYTLQWSLLTKATVTVFAGLCMMMAATRFMVGERR